MEPFRAMHYEIKPPVGDRVVGQAFTADLPMGSSKLAARMIDEAGAGDILVLAGRGDCRGSLWGDYKSPVSYTHLHGERGNLSSRSLVIVLYCSFFVIPPYEKI